MGLFDNLTDNYSIKANVDNYVNDKPMQSSSISSAINNFVNSDKSSNDNGAWMQGLSGVTNLLNKNQNAGGANELVEFNPIIAQPQYLNTNFQNQPSYLGGNLYNYLVR